DRTALITLPADQKAAGVLPDGMDVRAVNYLFKTPGGNLYHSGARDAVMQAVTLLGYRPNANAQALATQVSDTIGVVVMDVSDAF
ncbi:hypothetical protein MJL79_30685, partial [Salmonella enterica subsp. enterica serovar Montevideo]|nr:hypothetical protein [Salmonella enterica subsp. enterica serovar Montevideo]